LRSADAFGRPVALVFEGHTYSRTKSFFGDYVQLLRLPHVCGVLPIYAAREQDTGEVSGKALAEASHAAFLPTYEEAARFLIRAAGKGCTLLLVGAGGVVGVLPYLSTVLLKG
jgi:UDP-N-acetylmuramate--alanine ligase